MLLLLALACPPPPEKRDDTADDGIDCRAQCLDMETIAIEIGAEGDPDDPITSEAWRAMCEDSVGKTDCEACFTYIQDAGFASHSISWDCGCGLDLDGIRECRQDPELDDATAREALDSCEETCRAL